MGALVSASMQRVGKSEPLRRPTSAPPAPTIPKSHMREPPPPTASRLLSFDLSLLTGANTLTLFPRGTFDEYTFFQRQVDGDHELEYVTCLDQVHGEAGRSYGLFKLNGSSEPLLRLSQQRDLWDRINEQCRLHQLPDARTVITKATKSYDPWAGAHSGRNTVTPPRGDLYRFEGQRSITYTRALEILREYCRPRQLIAWIESGIPNAQPRAILHRYYLDAHQNVYLVRHHNRTRRLFIPRRCADPTDDLRKDGPVPEWPPKH